MSLLCLVEKLRITGGDEGYETILVVDVPAVANEVARSLGEQVVREEAEHRPEWAPAQRDADLAVRLGDYMEARAVGRCTE